MHGSEQESSRPSSGAPLFTAVGVREATRRAPSAVPRPNFTLPTGLIVAAVVIMNGAGTWIPPQVAAGHAASLRLSHEGLHGPGGPGDSDGPPAGSGMLTMPV